MIKRLFSALVATFVLAGFLLIAPVQAFEVVGDQCESGGEVSNTSVCQNRNQTSNPVAGPNGVITRVVNILSWVIGVVSVIIVLYGGLKYVTSNGDSNAISSAKNTILYALIGIAVAVFAQAIIIFVLSKI